MGSIDLCSVTRSSRRGSAAFTFAALVACLLAGLAPSSVLAWEPLPSPLYETHFSEFTEIGRVNGWDVSTGTWAADGATYNSTAAVAKALSTMNAYYTDPISGQDYPIQVLDDYTYRLLLANDSASADTMVGFVYNYQDDDNYYEVVFTPARVAQVRRVAGGVATVMSSHTYSEGGQGRWLTVELVRKGNAKSTVSVNGNLLVRDLPQSALPDGKLGLVTYNTTAKFEDVAIYMPVGTQPYWETFQDGIAQDFTIDPNHWQIADGVLKNFTVAQANTVVLGLLPYEYQTAAIRVRMFNPYTAPGNVMGVFVNNNNYGRYEVLFNSSGVAKLNRVDQNGASTTVATAPIPVIRRQWFEVEFVAALEGKFIYLNGQRLFANEAIPSHQYSEVGLVTHWTPGRFDVVEFQYAGFPRPLFENFTTAPRAEQIIAGTWTTSGGTYNSTARGVADISLIAESPSHFSAPRASVDFVYRARLLNQSGTGSVGLVTHLGSKGYFGYLRDSGGHYEVLFTANGQIHVDKHVQGTVVRQATGTHTIPANTWFEVEIRCVDNKTTIAVNGIPRLSGILQGQFPGGYSGLVTHSAVARFDNVSWAEIK